SSPFQYDNATELLEFLERQPCDLIVSDLSLPSVDGFDFISALKKNNRLAGIPALAFTASTSDETRERALAAGFVGYVVKRRTWINCFPSLLKASQSSPDPESSTPQQQGFILVCGPRRLPFVVTTMFCLSEVNMNTRISGGKLYAFSIEDKVRFSSCF